MEKTQREYYLNEQLKAIQKELGEIEDGKDESTNLKKSILKSKMPKEIEKKCLSELKKLKNMSPMSAEATVVRNYLEWMIDLPWFKKDKVDIDLNNATKTLDVAYKGNNIEWMIKTMPGHSALNAEMFIRQLETNIQRQQFITGINIPHKQKTTLSKEDNDKLLEAVPELKEAPFLNPNTLSPAAINAMLKLNI